jgi:histidinol-phosphatase (PHP family)
MGDYHVHLHEHGAYRGRGPRPGEYPDGLIESYVEHAAANGFAEVGFTEHLYRCVEAADVLGDFWEGEPKSDLAGETAAMVVEDRTLSINGYVEAVVAAKERGLPVKLGLEVDFFPETIDAVLAFLEPYPWDYLVGAVHWVGGWSIDYAPSSYEFARRGVRQAYEDYFAVEAQLAASGAFDVIAHVDVVKIFGDVLADQPADLYEPVVTAAAATGTAVEVSSAGLRKPVGEIYPAPRFLEMFHDAGVAITLASDAHRAEECGSGAADVIDAARAAGYREYLEFTERVPTKRSLEDARRIAIPYNPPEHNGG